jgi:hypothetical protein
MTALSTDKTDKSDLLILGGGKTDEKVRIF